MSWGYKHHDVSLSCFDGLLISSRTWPGIKSPQTLTWAWTLDTIQFVNPILFELLTTSSQLQPLPIQHTNDLIHSVGSTNFLLHLYMLHYMREKVPIEHRNLCNWALGQEVGRSMAVKSYFPCICLQPQAYPRCLRQSPNVYQIHTSMKLAHLMCTRNKMKNSNIG